MDEKVNTVIDILKNNYPDAKCELNYNSPFQLLIATVLSAQTTDVKVNEVTSKLFKDYPTIDDFLNLTQNNIEDTIKKLGLYRNKSKNIYQLCRQLKDDFNGEVPSEMNQLTTLAGVGRKTANVVMSNAFNKPAIAVDTHVFRVSNRIGIAKAKNVRETELQLMDAIDEELWSLTHHLLIFHGRRCCTSRKPQCARCKIKEHCIYFQKHII